MISILIIIRLQYEKGKKVPCYQPVIPGSEIRGMFRSNFEILTSSCLSSLDSDMLLSKRTMESFLPGLIYRDPRTGTYTLYAAEDVLWRTEGRKQSPDKEELGCRKRLFFEMLQAERF